MEDKRKSGWTVSESDVLKIGGKFGWHRAWKMQLTHQLIPPLFSEASLQMVSMEDWLSRSHSLVRTGLKISGRSVTGLMQWWNLPRARTILFFKQSWIILTENGIKQPTSKEGLWYVIQDAWRTIPEDYVKKLQDNLSWTVQAVLTNTPWALFRLGEGPGHQSITGPTQRQTRQITIHAHTHSLGSIKNHQLT